MEKDTNEILEQISCFNYKQKLKPKIKTERKLPGGRTRRTNYLALAEEELPEEVEFAFVYRVVKDFKMPKPSIASCVRLSFEWANKTSVEEPYEKGEKIYFHARPPHRERSFSINADGGLSSFLLEAVHKGYLVFEGVEKVEEDNDRG